MKNCGRPRKSIILTKDELKSLEALIVASSSNSRMKLRAEIIFLSASGLKNIEIEHKLNISKTTVLHWRNRYLSHRLEGLKDKPRSGRKSKPVQVDDNNLKVLSEWSKSRSLPQFLVNRAKIIMLAVEEKSNTEIASSIGITSSTVRKWKRSFRKYGLEGLYDEYRPGRPKTYAEEEIAVLLKKTLESKPEGATHWSCRSMAEETGISPSTIKRTWSLFSIKPHRQNHFKISTDPFFVDKVIDVCGLYLNPPDNALVLCVDEKSQCQALERTQPILPMGLGYDEGVTDNYYRHGVTTLFSALDIASGKVEVACKKRHRHQEFLSFLNQIKRNVPKNLDIHIILDNYSTHKHEKVKAWITRNPNFHFHFTPTYSSWLNQVERWFGIITDKAIRRGSFTSTQQLVEKISEFTDVYNRNPKPFVWTATPKEIFEKLGRLCGKLSNNELRKEFTPRINETPH